jgi:hypothetical protein
VAMQRVTRRSFVTSVGAASVLPAAAVLGETQVTAPGKENSTNAAATVTPDLSASDRPTYLLLNSAEVLFVRAANSGGRKRHRSVLRVRAKSQEC